jgi:hypothetical protein
MGELKDMIDSFRTKIMRLPENTRAAFHFAFEKTTYAPSIASTD